MNEYTIEKPQSTSQGTMMDGADAPGSPPVPEVATRASVIARLDAMKAKDGPASNTEQSARSDGLAEFGIVTTP